MAATAWDVGIALHGSTIAFQSVVIDWGDESKGAGGEGHTACFWSAQHMLEHTHKLVTGGIY
jgi:hypothetical protein